jgi:hypothetical protein
VDWKGCGRKYLRPNWSIIWNGTDDIGWWLDPIWGALSSGTDVKECCLFLILSAMWIGKNLTGSIHDEFEVKFGLNQLTQDDVLT